MKKKFITYQVTESLFPEFIFSTQEIKSVFYLPSATKRSQLSDIKQIGALQIVWQIGGRCRYLPHLRPTGV
ncbi:MULTISPECIES: hypothetical protein [unclassified Bacteroides]|uniref:hypothetical protein n=1 Tax=Bacteroides TaxID=816 RepID=UPI001058D1CA|nr:MULTISPECIES: hypothetical protein [unclassified Bacteroides]